MSKIGSHTSKDKLTDTDHTYPKFPHFISTYDYIRENVEIAGGTCWDEPGLIYLAHGCVIPLKQGRQALAPNTRPGS